MLIEILEPDFVFENESGKLTQLVHSGYSQVNVVTSTAGSTRGGHYHAVNREAFYVVAGSFVLCAYNKNGTREEYHFSAGDMFLIPPHIGHTFAYEQDTVLVALYDKGVEFDHGKKDILEMPLDCNSTG